MAILDPERSIVVVIDIQGKLVELIHRPQLVLDATVRLLRIAELFDVPAVMTEQYPQGIGPTHETIRAAFDSLSVPHRRVEKDSFGCCGEAKFLEAVSAVRPEKALEDLQVVLVGIEAHICVAQTALELLERGAEVQICWEGVSGRGPEYRQWALERMLQAGASVTNHESAAFEWAKNKNHPRFKELNRLLREGQLA